MRKLHAFTAAAALAALLAAPPRAVRADDVKDKANAVLNADTRDYDQLDLSIDVDLDLDAQTLRGKAVHRLASMTDALSSVRMHLQDMTVTSAAADGAACAFEQRDGLLLVALDRPRKKGEELTLSIEYGGKPTSGLWFSKPTSDRPDVPTQVFSQGQGEENRHWFPCYDLPDDRMTTSLRVVVPPGMQTLSNGDPQGVDTLPDGRLAHRWKLPARHPSYLVTLVVGVFHERIRDAAGVKLHDLVPPDWKDWCDEVFGRTPAMMEFFQAETGQPWAWGRRYSQVTVWDFMYGGMENTGATTLNMRALHKAGVRPDYTADGLIAHELAHQWFGDLLTCRTWNHIWLNEGYANYMTDLWVEHEQGPDAGAVAMLAEQDGYMGGADLKAVAAKPRPKPFHCGDLKGAQYVKGASVLHMLRGLLGRDVMREGVRRYLADNRDRAVVSEDLRAALEKVSGQDLSWFFEQWVYQSGFPEISVATSWDAKDGAVHVLVSQTQPVSESLPLFRTPVDVEVRWADGTATRRRCDLFRAKHDWRIAGPGEPKLVLFDPDGWLLARVTETKDRKAWGAHLDPSVPVVSRIDAVRALGGMGVDAVANLSHALGDPRFEVRAEACQALGKIGGPLVADALASAAKDKDSRVRRAAANALANVPAAQSAPALRPLLEDPSDYVAADASWALGKVKAEGAFDALVAQLARESHRDQVRQRTMDGLRELGDPRGAAVARRYLGYEWGKGIQHQLRKAALDAVVGLAPQDPETRATVLSLLDDPYFRMKSWAAEKCGDLKLAEAVPALERMQQTAVGPWVRDAAKAALGRLK
ncbi:MAG: hypothetical protein HMLKMBBP_03820 [Planctomycetes bacterium]|nr:hypothetical protein [Planctomycetota bacterium]